MSELRAQVVVAGGGLAGAAVASWVQAYGLAVLWLTGPPGAIGASQAAAGLVNVVTGVRPALSWQAPVLLEAFWDWLVLPQVASAAQGCWHPMPVYRRLATLALYNDWCGLAGRVALPSVELAPQAEPWQPALLGDHPAGLRQTGLGWMDLPALLPCLQANLAATGLHIEADGVDWPRCDPATGRIVTLQGHSIHADHIVSAEGIAVNANPFRPFRPLAPLKGQLLTVQLDPPPALHWVLTGGHYVLPIGGGHYHVGSTYEHRFDTAAPTAEARTELLAGLHDHLPGWQGTTTVVDHRAGIRATTPDRHALLMQHPQHRHLWFLNGLGTKGLLQAPAAARMLVQSLVAGNAVWGPEWDGGRKVLRP